MTVWPDRSSTRAPGGTTVVSKGPTDSMVVPRTITVWSARAGAPVPSISWTWVSATNAALTLTNGWIATGTSRSCPWSATTISNPAVTDIVRTQLSSTQSSRQDG